MLEFWEMIVKTNTFNFAILLLIFAIIFVKLNIPKIIENIKNDIINTVDNAQSEKLTSLNELDQTKNLVKNTDNEVAQQLNRAKISAKTLENDIKSNTSQQITNIEKNIERVIKSEEQKTHNELTEKTINSAIELAKLKIKSSLKEDETLHNRLLDNCLDELRNA